MAGTLFFVHGTGVRQEGYESLVATIRKSVQDANIDASVVAPDWGPKLGVKYDLVDDTLPYISTRDATGTVNEAQTVVAMWSVLAEDPLAELRVAGIGADDAAGGVVVGGQRPDQALVTTMDATSSRLPDLSYAGVDAADVGRSIVNVRSSAEVGEAALAVGDHLDTALIDAVARAVVADIVWRHRTKAIEIHPRFMFDGEIRDQLVQDVAAALIGEGTRSIAAVDWVKKRFGRYVLGKATEYVIGRRQSLMTMANPAIGDILFYQQRGEDMRKFVAAAAGGLQPPVVAVGHSLGGIVLVDLLTGPNAPPVDLLVTAGSQSPLFYAIDALAFLRRGDGNNPFQPWLNIYNPSDFLSFRAEGVFGRSVGIADIPIDPGVPFPEAHSAYWHNARVFAEIKRRWPRG